MSEKSEKAKNISDISSCEVGFRCSYNGWPSNVVWFEINKVKSLDIETSSYSQLDEFKSLILYRNNKATWIVLTAMGFVKAHFILFH